MESHLIIEANSIELNYDYLSTLWKQYLMIFFTKFTSWLPLTINRILGQLIGTLLYYFKSTPYKIARRNLELCFPERNDKQLDKLCYESLIETGKMLVENGPIFLAKNKKPLQYIKSVQGIEHLEAAVKNDQGVILAVPHIGSWELLILYCSNIYATTVLYRPFKSSAFDQLVLQARSRYGAKLVPSDTSGVRELFKTLKRNELAIILPDHEPKYGEGIFTPFFNRMAYTSTLTAKLAQKTNATVLMAYMERLPGSSGYQLHFNTIENYNQLSIDEKTAAVNQSIEQVIHSLPEQYLWIYRRFRTQPDNENNLYK